jgi:hypothetical protein
MKVHRIFLLSAAILVLFSCGGHRSANAPAKLQPQPPQAQQHTQSLTAALSELDALDKPDGVDAKLWDELKGALRTALEEKYSSGTPRSLARLVDNADEPGLLARRTRKITSTPPTGDANRVNDLAIADNGDGTYSLTWHYRNLGDYNQDGVVGIADITPLAIHYNETWATGEENSLAAVIDGSNNNRVDIADVTPIAMNFGSECTGYTVTGAGTFFGSYQQLASVPITFAGATERIACEATVGSSSGSYYHVTPTDSSSAPGADSVTGVAPGAAAPAKWHVMVFAGGDNNLNLAVINDLNTLNSNFSSDDSVGASYSVDLNVWEQQNVVPYAGFSYVGSDHSKDVDLNPDTFNSASPASLTQYLEWVKANWPAEHYCLVMSDHGGSWTKNASGIMTDETSAKGIQMEIPDMANVIRQSGLPVNVLVFEACDMASVEVMNDLVGVTDYVVASQTLQSGDPNGPPYPLAGLASWLQASPTASPKSLAVKVSDLYKQTYSGLGFSTTSSTVSTAVIPGLVSAIADFTTVLSSNLGTQYDEILGSYEATWRNLIPDGDIGDFLSLIRTNVSDGTLMQRISAVEAQLNAAVLSNQVLYDSSDNMNEDTRHCKGLTIHMPLTSEYEGNTRAQYLTLSFDEQTQWSGFLDALHPSANCHTTNGNAMGGMITWDTSSPGTWGPELDLYVWEPLPDGNGQMAYIHGSPQSVNGLFSLGLQGVNDAAYERWDALARINRGEYVFLADYVSDGPLEWSCYITFVGYMSGEEFSAGPYYLNGQSDYGSELGPGWIAFTSEAFDRTVSSAKGLRQCTLREAGLTDVQIAGIKRQVKQIEASKTDQGSLPSLSP